MQNTHTKVHAYNILKASNKAILSQHKQAMNFFQTVLTAMYKTGQIRQDNMIELTESQFNMYKKYLDHPKNNSIRGRKRIKKTIHKVLNSLNSAKGLMSIDADRNAAFKLANKYGSLPSRESVPHSVVKKRSGENRVIMGRE